jgi:hypothetical protein
MRLSQSFVWAIMHQLLLGVSIVHVADIFRKDHFDLAEFPFIVLKLQYVLKKPFLMGSYWLMKATCHKVWNIFFMTPKLCGKNVETSIHVLCTSKSCEPTVAYHVETKSSVYLVLCKPLKILSLLTILHCP